MVKYIAGIFHFLGVLRVVALRFSLGVDTTLAFFFVFFSLYATFGVGVGLLILWKRHNHQLDKGEGDWENLGRDLLGGVLFIPACSAALNMIDCVTSGRDYTLELIPGTTCWEGSHIAYAFFAILFLFAILPFRLETELSVNEVQ